MASRGRSARVKGATFERDLAKYFTDNTKLEAKRQKRCRIKAAMQQAIDDANVNGKIPVAITKDDRADILCTMRLDDWIKLFNAYIDTL